MLAHDKKAFYKFFLTYFVSVALLILSAGYFYQKQIYNQLFKAEHFSIIKYAKRIKSGDEVNDKNFHYEVEEDIIEDFSMDNIKLTSKYFIKKIPYKWDIRKIEVKTKIGWKEVASTDTTPLVAVAHTPPGDYEGEAHIVEKLATSSEKDYIPILVGFDRVDYAKYADYYGAILLTHTGPGVRYWSLFPAPFAEKPKTPAVSIPWREASQLSGKRVRVEVETEYTESITPALKATIGDTSAPSLLLVAHICHPKPGGHDNASGVVVSTEVINLLKYMKDVSTKISVELLIAPEYMGYAAALDNKLIQHHSTIAVISIDMVAANLKLTGGCLRLFNSPYTVPSPLDPVLDTILRKTQGENYCGSGLYTYGSDHDLAITYAVPGSLLNEWPDTYYHTSLDKPSNIDQERITTITSSIATAIAITANKINNLHQLAELQVKQHTSLLLENIISQEKYTLENNPITSYTKKVKQKIRRTIEGEHTPPEPLLGIRPVISKRYLYMLYRDKQYTEEILSLPAREYTKLQEAAVLATSIGEYDEAIKHIEFIYGKNTLDYFLKLREILRD